MLSKLLDKIRILFDPTMFRYNRNYMEHILPKPCMKCYGNSFTDDLIILFDNKCQHCMNIDINECVLKNKIVFDKIIYDLSNRISDLKNMKFKNKIILAFYVDPNKYASYTDFYRDFILRFKSLFVADFMILYGLKPKVKVLKCLDNILIGPRYDPIFIKESNLIIGGKK